jgi:tetratricopeptide (TPR) repeat protein
MKQHTLVFFSIFAFISISNCYCQTSAEYFNRAHDKIKQNDYPSAITDLTKAIALNPSSVEAYYDRAQCKRELKDNRGQLLP